MRFGICQHTHASCAPVLFSIPFADMTRRYAFCVKAFAGMIVLCGVLYAQSTKTEDLAAGKLLVMERDAPDPKFAESVILLTHYSEDGVVGLMLNRPSNISVSRLKEFDGTANRSDPLYVGGPVQLDFVTALVRTTNVPPDGIRVAADLYAVQTKQGLEAALKTSKGTEDLRIYLGYCGWTLPQLENEVKLGSWYIFNSGEAFTFDSTPSTLWKRLIDKTELHVAFAPMLRRQ
jgi:putative transcriptional regulator